jgi:hypothetical protein
MLVVLLVAPAADAMLERLVLLPAVPQRLLAVQRRSGAMSLKACVHRAQQRPLVACAAAGAFPAQSVRQARRALSSTP